MAKQKNSGGLGGYADRQRAQKGQKPLFISLDEIQKGLRKPKVRGG